MRHLPYAWLFNHESLLSTKPSASGNQSNKVDGQTGQGPKPFAFELGNEIIVRLTLGATLRLFALAVGGGGVRGWDERMSGVRLRLKAQGDFQPHLSMFYGSKE